MKPIILLFSLILFGLTSCNTAYKTLQTPDDVYYSSGKPEGFNEETAKKDDPMNRDMRMRSRDRRWREFDDWNYDPYRYGYNYPYYYNPYYYAYPVFGCYTCGFWGPSFIRNSTPRMTNLGSYYNTDTKVLNTKTGTVTNLSGTDRYNNSNNNRNIFRGSRSSGSDGIRTYSPSSSPSIRSSGGGAPVFRPRGN
jgi:hypothetical protein